MESVRCVISLGSLNKYANSDLLAHGMIQRNFATGIYEHHAIYDVTDLNRQTADFRSLGGQNFNISFSSKVP